MTDFEDPTQLARCIKSDCQAYRAGNTPLCAQHLREQEIAAGATSISEPELEERARAAGDAAMKEDVVLMDPDVNGGRVDMEAMNRPKVALTQEMIDEALRLHVPTWNQRVGIDPPDRPDPTELEPFWDGTQWVLREKSKVPVLTCPWCHKTFEVQVVG